MGKGWHKQPKKIDELLNELLNVLTLLIALRVEEFTYDRCRAIRRSAHQLEKLILRNERMRRNF